MSHSENRSLSSDGSLDLVSGGSRNFWTVCRRYYELQLPCRLTLQQWAQRGRLLSGDYIFDRRLDTWVCARDLAELEAFFRSQKANRAQRAAWFFLVLCSLTLFAAPFVAGLFAVAAGAMLVLKYHMERSVERGGPNQHESQKSYMRKVHGHRIGNAGRGSLDRLLISKARRESSR